MDSDSCRKVITLYKKSKKVLHVGSGFAVHKELEPNPPFFPDPHFLRPACTIAELCFHPAGSESGAVFFFCSKVRFGSRSG